MNATDYETLVYDRVHLKSLIEEAENRIKEIDTQLINLGKGSHDIAGARVTISANRRINAARFTAAYPVKENSNLYKVEIKPDTTAIREHLAPYILDEYYDSSSYSVRVN